MVKKIKDYVAAGNFVLVTPETSVKEAITKAAEKGLGGVLIEKNGEVVGIFTENDLGKKVVAKGKDITSTKLAEVMTKEPVFVDMDTDVDSCMFMMMRNNFRHIPIRDVAGKVYGVACVRDVLKAKVEEVNEMSESSNMFEASKLIETSGNKEKDVIEEYTKEYKA